VTRCLLEFYDADGQLAARRTVADTPVTTVFDLLPGIARMKVTLTSGSDGRPPASILLAACEVLARLVRDEFGDGPLAQTAFIHTQASPGQVQAIEAVEAYWAAAEPPEGAET
jgi:hypothetical protein